MLSVVATPIGNLEDITLRALRVLREADAILCEDTRVTGKLLARYEIKKPLIRYDAHSTEGSSAKILDLLREGKRLALVSDAGTPCISDPGVRLVQEVRAALGEDAPIETIPGPSAVIAALAICGIPASAFLFLGFLPHKHGRASLFSAMAASELPTVFYESTHRIKKTLLSLSEHLPEGFVAVAKELTKVHEQVIRGTPADILARFDADPHLERGEFVVIVAPADVRYTEGV